MFVANMANKFPCSEIGRKLCNEVQWFQSLNCELRCEVHAQFLKTWKRNWYKFGVPKNSKAFEIYVISIILGFFGTPYIY